MVIYSGFTNWKWWFTVDLPFEHGDLRWIYPLNMVIYGGFTLWTWWFIKDLPFENGDFPRSLWGLLEGYHRSSPIEIQILWAFWDVQRHGIEAAWHDAASRTLAQLMAIWHHSMIVDEVDGQHFGPFSFLGEVSEWKWAIVDHLGDMFWYLGA